MSIRTRNSALLLLLLVTAGSLTDGYIRGDCDQKCRTRNTWYMCPQQGSASPANGGNCFHVQLWSCSYCGIAGTNHYYCVNSETSVGSCQYSSNSEQPLFLCVCTPLCDCASISDAAVVEATYVSYISTPFN